MNINKQRVLDEFFELIKIPCPSLGEREVADLLKKRLEALGGKITEDMLAAKVKAMSSAAAALGVTAEMTGREALLKMGSVS